MQKNNLKIDFYEIKLSENHVVPAFSNQGSQQHSNSQKTFHLNSDQIFFPLQTMTSFEYDHTDDYWNSTIPYLWDCNINLDDNQRRVALFLIYLFVFMVGLLENLLVVWVNWGRRHAANGVLFCIINISLSDLMVIVIQPFFMLEAAIDYVWLWGHFLCRVTKLIYSINFYSSTFFLAAMTVERYLSLIRPSSPALFPVTGKRRWVLCAGLWLFSFFLTVLENIHVQLLGVNEPGCFIFPAHNYFEWSITLSVLSLLFQFVLPGTVIITCNVLIARAVKTAPDVQGSRDVWLVHLYSLVFVMCWLPYHLIVWLLVIDEYDPYILSCNAVLVLLYTYNVVECLSLFHCIANPILYNFLSKSFKNNLFNKVLSHIPREVTVDQMAAVNQHHQVNGAGTEPGKQRKLSNTSTSQSDVES